MTIQRQLPDNPLVFGHDPAPGLVAVEHKPGNKGTDQVVLFTRQHDDTVRTEEPFHPFVWTERGGPDCPNVKEVRALAGKNRLDALLVFNTWTDFSKARGRLAKEIGFTPGSPDAPFFAITDPVQQYLMRAGRTLFKGMSFGRVKRLQVDIETYTADGFDFSNARRAEDRIIAVALADQSGWTTVLRGDELDEKTLLEQFVTLVQTRDPDVIEGHNIFNFDLPYITERAKRHRVTLALGRDGSVPRRHPSRFSIGERTIAYTRFDIFGRHVVDTLFMVQAYDITHRSLEGFGLKEVAVHFGLAAPDRTYVDGADIASTFRADPDRLMAYTRDDIVETRALSNLLSPSYFAQAHILPYGYQNICVRGNAAKIDALLLREYLRQEHAVPVPSPARGFAGGYTDLFVEGVSRNVHHCDVRSLYPSLMLNRGKGPDHDELGVFLTLLDYLKAFRLKAKKDMQNAPNDAARTYFDALQGTFKILINSFYGYLGFGLARFNDFAFAEDITAQGRALLKSMIGRLRKHGAQPIEIDTDGVYFVPPTGTTREKQDTFRRVFAEALPTGIDIEFDGEYEAMYAYKMKNYALLQQNGDIVIKGAALKSRGLEPFQREFLREMIRLKLEGRDAELTALKNTYSNAIVQRRWPIRMLAKTERLRDAPATYQAKAARKKRGRSAAYELALAAARPYQAGDQIAYYVTGNKKSVAVHTAAKLAAEWDPANRDENIPYYVAKLEALYEKFCAPR